MNATPYDSQRLRDPSRAGRDDARADSSRSDASRGDSGGRAPKTNRFEREKTSPESRDAAFPGNAAPASDEQLLAAYRDGDKPSFQMLVTRYQRELYHFLVRFLGNRAAAEDIFQETFLQVHQSADAFDPQRRFKPWLFTIAANKARDMIRANARRPTNPLQASISNGDDESGEFIDLMQAVGETPDEPMARQELQHKVQGVVGTMPEHLREILVLSYFNTFPYRQIADILGIPLGTVKSRLHAAVATFAEKWKAANRSRGMS